MIDKVIFWTLGGALFFSIALLGTLMTTFFYTISATQITLTEVAATTVCLLLLWAFSVLRPQHR